MALRLPRSGLPQIAAFLAILAINWTVSPQFFDIRLQDGRLFGSLIDVFNRGAPVALLSPSRVRLTLRCIVRATRSDTAWRFMDSTDIVDSNGVLYPNDMKSVPSALASSFFLHIRDLIEVVSGFLLLLRSFADGLPNV
eukprot:gene59232-81102_t